MRHQKPSIMQIKTLHLMTQGKSKRNAMIQAGYSISTADHKSSIVDTPLLMDILTKVKYELLKDPNLSASFISEKFKEWMKATKETKFGEVPDYQTQMGGYDRWKDLVDNAEDKNNRKNVSKRITFEEFVTGEEKDDTDIRQ